MQHVPSAASSRPKIHKLPAIESKPQRKFYTATVFVIGAALSLVVAVFVFNGFVALVAKQLHPIADDKAGQIAQLAPISNAHASSGSIADKEYGVSGQLAVMPGHQGAITDIETMSEVDRREGQELLSIVSKY